MTLAVGSLFAGIGGIDLGLKRAGMRVRWQVERDDYCRRVLARSWPSTDVYSDVREVDPESLPAVDLVSAGFPCQPVSSQGQKGAQDDERWLWSEVERILRGVEPRYVLLENVPGLFTRGMGTVLGGLASLGYDAEWAVLSPCTVGAPHHRGRVFILAYPNDRGCGGIQPEPEILHEAARESWWTWQPSCRRRARGWRENGARVLRPSGPPVGRVADGLPRRVDRLTALGNAVVPQVAEHIGRLILEADAR